MQQRNLIRVGIVVFENFALIGNRLKINFSKILEGYLMHCLKVHEAYTPCVQYCNVDENDTG